MNIKMENPQLTSTQKSFKEKQLNIRQIFFKVIKALSIPLPPNAPHQTMRNGSPNNNILDLGEGMECIKFVGNSLLGVIFMFVLIIGAYNPQT